MESKIELKKQEIAVLEAEIDRLKMEESKMLSWQDIHNAIYDSFLDNDFISVSSNKHDMQNMVSMRTEEEDIIMKLTGVKAKLFPELIKDIS